MGSRVRAGSRGVDVDEVRRERMAQIPARRLGDPAEFGGACAYLCSVQAGYITGQNLLVDGGLVKGI